MKTHHLPAQPTPLIGREREIAVVRQLLLSPEVHLLTIIGPGGVGKTRLAVQLAAELLGSFADGVFFVSLAPISDPGFVASTIALTLGLREAGGRQVSECLSAYLQDRQLLLLLDNFEQVSSAAPQIAGLLAGCPGLKVLVTSRASLHLRAEREFPLSPLALPDRKQPAAIDALTRYAAVQLFTERVLAVKPDFQATGTGLLAIAEICQRLDGLPLAIELAAARVKLLSPLVLLARLIGMHGSTSLRLLTGGPQDLPVRQQTLRNTIEWSYNLLSTAEQKLFRRLSVFVGGCTRLEAEHDNLRAALHRSFAWEELLTTLRFCVVLWRFWLVRGYLSEGRRWLEEVLARTGGVVASMRAKALIGAGTLTFYQGDYGPATIFFEESLAIFRQLGEQQGVTAALGGLAQVANVKGDYARACTLCEESVTILRHLSDKWSLANALCYHGIALWMRSDFSARTLYEEALFTPTENYTSHLDNTDNSEKRVCFVRGTL